MRPFRFGVNMTSISTRDDWVDRCRQVEQLGYDVLMVADHLGMPDPFAALATAAEVTERPRLGTFVLNAAFWNPAILARSAATVDLLSAGRLELGLGTGYIRSEFERAGLPWTTPAERVDRLERTITEVTGALADDDYQPAPVQRPHPPLLIGGNGNRMLRLAAEHAAIAGFTGAASDESLPGGLRPLAADELAERVDYFRGQAGDRLDEIELNLLVQQVVVTDDRRAHAERFAAYFPGWSIEQILELPIFLVGTVDEIVAQVHATRQRYGFSYFTVLDPYLEAFAPVLKEL